MSRELNPTDLRQEIQSCLSELFHVESGEGLDDNASLLGEGVLDSTGLLELVAELEDRYGFVVEDHEIVPNNFDSLAALCRYVRSKLSD